MLEITVIGGRIGESIVIHTPGNQYGVIDCYASEPDDDEQNPTIQFLCARGVRQLRFVALSHPHMDHFRGLASLFRHYEGAIEAFWRFPIGSLDWNAYFAGILEEGKVSASLSERKHLKEKIEVFRSVLALAASEKRRGMRTLTTEDEKTLLEELSHRFTIFCVGPSSDIVKCYQDSMMSGVQCSRNNFVDTRHNTISSVLVLRYRSWYGILGGDTEKQSWDDILNRSSKTPHWLSRAKLVKVSHHGSPTGSFPVLWNRIRSSRCDAIVTNYTPAGLPVKEGLAPIWERGYHVYSTHLRLARRSCSLTELQREPHILLPGFRRVRESWGSVQVNVDREGTSEVSCHAPAGLLSGGADRNTTVSGPGRTR